MSSQHAEDLYSRRIEANKSNEKSTELMLIEKTGHTFGAIHPFDGTTAALEEVITLILDFLKNKS